ncbi:MAG: hypothetical protein COA60_000365 [Robiginitomaculum sp.]|nr:hypothetical protein [Robiginitomaculum sp.]
MLINILILLVVGLTFLAILQPKVYSSTGWRATITPLASIIGSGFLILGPVLVGSFGKMAVLAMAALCVLSYLYGSAIRFNIARIEVNPKRSHYELSLDYLASWALAFAYIVSVAYYLNLLGAFAISLLPFASALLAKLLTTLVFLLILIVGWTRGFSALERMEQISVSIKLAIITGLLVGLAWFSATITNHVGILQTPAEITGWPAIALLFGLLITVQGFETSRYLGEEYPAKLRIKSMRWAQWMASLIYIVYITLISLTFSADEIIMTETGIIDMMRIVSPALPLLLVAAALSAQFSAAIADTGGAGGLFAEASNNRINVRTAYVLLGVIGISLTWLADIFTIIRYASQAFAVYYTLQALIAALGAYQQKASVIKVVIYCCLAVIGVLIVFFAQSIEG